MSFCDCCIEIVKKTVACIAFVGALIYIKARDLFEYFTDTTEDKASDIIKNSSSSIQLI